MCVQATQHLIFGPRHFFDRRGHGSSEGLSYAGLASSRCLPGFLGLIGYYRKFIRDFGHIAAPLTKLLCKDGFRWTEEATTAFDKLKQIIAMAPVLQLPDFTKDFIIDCDVFGAKFWAVLHQGG